MSGEAAVEVRAITNCMDTAKYANTYKTPFKNDERTWNLGLELTRTGRTKVRRLGDEIEALHDRTSALLILAEPLVAKSARQSTNVSKI